MEITISAQGGERLLERALFALVEKRASHCVAIAGVMEDYLLVLDSVNGESIVQFRSFPGAYFEGATIGDYCFTKPGS